MRLIQPCLENATLLVALVCSLALAGCGDDDPVEDDEPTNGGSFELVETTIEDIHGAIVAGEITCTELIQAYLKRAKAYNGICSQLLTADGAPVPAPAGVIRSGVPLAFPTETIAASTLLPDLDQYTGVPIEFGRMEATASDPAVEQQFGYLVGIPNARQVNALSTLNLRGERSVTCQGACDTHPSSGAIPNECPDVCEPFRAQADALERAAALDDEYGSKPDLEAFPMYCIPFAFKDVFDTQDMRSTGGADVDYAMDAAPKDSWVAAQLRAKGAIVYAKANTSEYNGGSGDPGGPARAKSRIYGAGIGSRSTWAGLVCNPYDTEREAESSSSGPGASVSANLAACSICEETGRSCQGPAAIHGIVGVVTTKGLIPYSGGIGADPYRDRAGIHCRTVADAARVLDALKDPEQGYFDSRDVYSAMPKALVSKEPYASFLVTRSELDGSGKATKPLDGIRIGIVREFMIKEGPNDLATSELIDAEIKILRDELGAELVESNDPEYGDDPAVPNMAFDFQRALAEVLPFHMPEYLFQTTDDGELEFSVPGYDVTSREYMAAAAAGTAPWPANLNLRQITSFPATASMSLHFAEYLLERGDARVYDWTTLNDNAKYFVDTKRAAFENWEAKLDIRSDGIDQRMKMQDVARMVLLKVMYENDLDALVNPMKQEPIAKIGGPSTEGFGGSNISALIGCPEIVVPAGFIDVIYEPIFALNAAKTSYTSVLPEEASKLANPQPISLAFWAGPGEEPALFKVASAYEGATRHRASPPDFGPLD